MKSCHKFMVNLYFILLEEFHYILYIKMKTMHNIIGIRQYICIIFRFVNLMDSRIDGTRN
jgi:hypothetical protein